MPFPETRWSLLAEATLHGDAAARSALDEFCRRYRAPIVAFILRRGVAPDRAEDVAHDFLVHVMEHSSLRRADAARGRFRSFLLGALVRFLGDTRDRDRALKRGGGVAPLSLDDDPAGTLAAEPGPEAATFDRAWAQGLIARALQALEDEGARRGRAAAFSVLRDFLPGSAHAPSYDEAAARLGVSTAAFKTELHRFRQRFRELLRLQVAQTVASPQEIDDEIAYIGRVLGAVPR